MDKRPARQAFVPALLIACLLIAGFWEVMAYFSVKPGKPLSLSARDFESFQPRSGEWSIRPCEMTPEHPSVENMLVYELKRTRPNESGPAGSSIPVVVRLVYGYNMPDCMRLKGYKVELMGERAKGQGARARREGARATSNIEHPTSNVERPTTNHEPRTENPEPRTANQELRTPGLLQVWRLTSDIGDVSIWESAMIRSGDFEWTDMDVRSMPFPRIAATLDQGWEPTGLSLKGLRHPVYNFRMFMLAKWNNARCDLLTFLRLRKGAWVSQDILTLVARSTGDSVSREAEPEVIREVLDAQVFMYGELLRWKQAQGTE